MTSLTGVPSNGPTKYMGPRVAYPIVVTRTRAPTTADYIMPETGKKYGFGTFWLVGKDPTTGVYGDLFYLADITANAGNWVKFISTLSARVITATGTYEPTAGTVMVGFEVIGGGGGSGGCPSTAGNNASGSGGGGSGGYSYRLVSIADVGSSIAVTIGAGGTAGSASVSNGGAGGTTSVGSLLQATGGGGGLSVAAAATGVGGLGGVGGVGSGGDFNCVGTPGGNGIGLFVPATFGLGVGGYGGSSIYGGGGRSSLIGNGGTAAATAGSNYGSGAGGCASLNSTAIAGAVGSAGIIKVTEYS